VKVAIVTHSLHKGGAALAALRLYKSLKMYTNLDVDIIACDDPSSSRYFYPIRPPRFFVKLLVLTKEFVFRRLLGHPDYVSVDLLGRIDPRRLSSYDIINIHWVNNLCLGLKDIPLLSSPLIWTLHDCWPFSGTFHHNTAQLNLYPQTPCLIPGNTPLKKIRSLLLVKLSNAILRIKLTNYKRCYRLLMVAPSSWMYDQLASSPFGIYSTQKPIPNPYISSEYFSGNPELYRDEFNIASEFVILYGAKNFSSDPNKGFDLFSESVNLLPYSVKSRATILLFGDRLTPGLRNLCDFHSVINLGFIDSPSEMRKLYVLSSVYVMSSRIENLPQTAVEALACGLPVCGFNVGGITELIRSSLFGFSVQPYDTTLLSKAIEHCLLNSNDSIRQYRSERMLSIYGDRVVAAEYLHLFSDLILGTL
jgi:glycosyltransferase involved in cell wall biosynthesis